MFQPVRFLSLHGCIPGPAVRTKAQAAQTEAGPTHVAVVREPLNHERFAVTTRGRELTGRSNGSERRRTASGSRTEQETERKPT
jgi:hypothetical protein